MYKPGDALHKDYWSDPDDIVTLITGGSDVVFPQVVVADDQLGTWKKVIIMLMFAHTRNTHSGAVNKTFGAHYLQVKEAAAGSFIDGLYFPDDMFYTPDADDGGFGAGGLFIGNIDVIAQVDGPDTYSFQGDDFECDQNNLILSGVQTGIRVFYRR
jgi:hypothetical protein